MPRDSVEYQIFEDWISSKISDADLRTELGDVDGEPRSEGEQLEGIRNLLRSLSDKEEARLQRQGGNPADANSIDAYWEVLAGSKVRNVSSQLRNRTIEVDGRDVTLQEIIRGRVGRAVDFIEGKEEREKRRQVEEEERERERQRRAEEQAQKERLAEETRNFSIYLNRIEQGSLDDFKRNKILQEIDDTFENAELKSRLQKEFFDKKQTIKGLTVSDRQKDFNALVEDLPTGLRGQNRNKEIVDRIEQKVLDRIEERARADPDGNAEAITLLPIEVIVRNFPQQLTSIGGIPKEAADLLKERYK